MLNKFFILSLLLIQSVCWTQSINDQIESISSNGERNLSDLIEEYNYYKSHPIDLNNASKKELNALILLNDEQINDIIDYRNSNNGFVNVQELQLLDSFDKERMVIYLNIFTTNSLLRLNQTSYFFSQIIRVGTNFNPIQGNIQNHNRPFYLFRNKQYINNKIITN